MEQNPARVGLQPSVGTGYSVIFKVTEQEGEGDETTRQDCEEGSVRTIGLLGGPALPSSFRYLEDAAELSQAELEGNV